MLQRLLAEGITAFVCEDERIGHKVISLAHARNLQVPRDFSLAVLGDPLSLVELDYGWTTFKIPRREMGRSAVRLLVEMLSVADTPRQRVYRVVLPWRNSCPTLKGVCLQTALVKKIVVPKLPFRYRNNLYRKPPF